MARTFDDGPHPVFTPRVLEILARYGIRATFFCVGLCAQAHPELVASIVEEGHGVGNHTWSHPYLPDLTRDEVLRQVDATGADPDPRRAPPGSRRPAGPGPALRTGGRAAPHGWLTGRHAPLGR